MENIFLTQKLHFFLTMHPHYVQFTDDPKILIRKNLDWKLLQSFPKWIRTENDTMLTKTLLTNFHEKTL